MKLGKRLHREDIKAAIRKGGTTLAALSLKSELKERTVARSLTKPIPKANLAIAVFLGLTTHDLWPDWYDPTGKRILSRNKSKTSRKSALRQCKKDT